MGDTGQYPEQCYNSERWTLIAAATFMSAAKMHSSAGSGAPALSNAQIGNQTPLFDQNTSVNLGGELAGGGINPAGLDGQCFLAVDHSGTATNNYIYILASVLPWGANRSDVCA